MGVDAIQTTNIAIAKACNLKDSCLYFVVCIGVA
jgi:hypothetical protein